MLSSLLVHSTLPDHTSRVSVSVSASTERNPQCSLMCLFCLHREKTKVLSHVAVFLFAGAVCFEAYVELFPWCKMGGDKRRSVLPETQASHWCPIRTLGTSYISQLGLSQPSANIYGALHGIGTAGRGSHKPPKETFGNAGGWIWGMCMTWVFLCLWVFPQPRPLY